MNKWMKSITFAIAFLFVGISCAVAQNADKIVGTYSLVSDITKEASKVKIYKSGNDYEAQIVWLQHPNDASGKPKRDSKNPDENLRSRTIVGTVILKGLSYDKDEDNWSGGKIYDPATGKTYKVVCNFESEKKLKVRGYIGIPTFGRTLYWTKIQ